MWRIIRSQLIDSPLQGLMLDWIAQVMDKLPPEGSTISIKSELGIEKIVAPHPSGGIYRFLVVSFFIFWLGAWAIGWVNAVSDLITETTNGRAKGFLMFWLTGWTLGGIGVCWILILLLRSSEPEVFLINLPKLTYDSGIPPFTRSIFIMPFDYPAQRNMWKRFLRKRSRAEFQPHEIKTLRLREFDSGNRLTIDKGTTRYELGLYLTDVEREWLFRKLSIAYSVEKPADSS